ncbi:MAG: NADH-quinone oxidoreductase subunit J [Geodermatophilaceae bacterium]|nr:NADH-quinone oxidoreductase subunit J [Geodermatophilaceae bacterium]
MARATYALLVSFLAVAAELVLLGSAYLGVLTVLMMTVEMAVMGVFMIMYMMNPAGLMPMSMVHNKRGALSIAIGTFVVLGAGALLVPWPSRTGEPPAELTRALGFSLMGEHMLAMIVIGVALLATMISAVLLATDRGRYDRYGDELERDTPRDPVAGGVGR